MNENQVHVEREKTKRTLIVASAITIVGLVCAVMFFQNIDSRGGSLKITSDGVEVSLEKPIVDQVNVDTSRFKVLGDTISVSAGTVSNIKIEGGVDSGGFVGRRFNGRNLIDTASGFVLASDRPDRWQVQKIPSKSSGTQTRPDEIVSRLTSQDGSMIEVRTVPLRGAEPLASYVQRTLDSLRLIDPKANARMVDDRTWMLWHTNPATRVTNCTKIVDANGLRYFAQSTSSNPAAKASVRASVAEFVVIDKAGTTRQVR